MNLRMDKDGYIRCFQVLREHISTQNAQLSTSSAKNEQLVREKEELDNENRMLKAQMVQMRNSAEAQR